MKTCTYCNTEIKRVINKRTQKPFCDSECYGKWQKGRSFDSQGKKTKDIKTCSINECDKVHFGRGFCRSHYLSEYYNKLPDKKERLLKNAKEYTCKCCSKIFKATHKNPIFCSSGCSGKFKKKDRIIKKGYAKILKPDHHRADSKGYVFEHIIVAEKTIGREIKLPEEVHHIDKNPLNNSPENLMVCKDHEDHMRFHRG